MVWLIQSKIVQTPYIQMPYNVNQYSYYQLLLYLLELILNRCQLAKYQIVLTYIAFVCQSILIYQHVDRADKTILLIKILLLLTSAYRQLLQFGINLVELGLSLRKTIYINLYTFSKCQGRKYIRYLLYLYMLWSWEENIINV